MGKQVAARLKQNNFNIPNGGVAQLGEHLPCKQGVKSSNLSISIRWRIQCKSWDIFFESANWRRSCEATSNGSAKQRLLVPWKLHTEIDKRFFIKTSEKINHNKTVKKFTKRVFKTQDPVFQRYEIQLVKRSSKKERRVDALALRAEERRDKLRKAAGRCK